MTLIVCPECNQQVSDKAPACPNCGYPTPGRKTPEATPPQSHASRAAIVQTNSPPSSDSAPTVGGQIAENAGAPIQSLQHLVLAIEEDEVYYRGTSGDRLGAVEGNAKSGQVRFLPSGNSGLPLLTLICRNPPRWYKYGYPRKVPWDLCEGVSSERMGTIEARLSFLGRFKWPIRGSDGKTIGAVWAGAHWTGMVGNLLMIVLGIVGAFIGYAVLGDIGMILGLGGLIALFAFVLNRLMRRRGITVEINKNKIAEIGRNESGITIDQHAAIDHRQKMLLLAIPIVMSHSKSQYWSA